VGIPALFMQLLLQRQLVQCKSFDWHLNLTVRHMDLDLQLQQRSTCRTSALYILMSVGDVVAMIWPVQCRFFCGTVIGFQ
jgi:hypothetical protein